MKRLLSACVIAALACGGSNSKLGTSVSPPHTVALSTSPTSAPPVVAPDLPLWSAVHKGTLPNGLTYYVLKHDKPEKRVQMWLAVNAGSVDEDDDQRGLAHYTEHMAFNGTKRFPKDALVNYLQSIGMQFGADVNAYTSWQQTVYQIEVPSEKPEFVAKGFDILRDWAGDIAFDPEEVRKESGVVLEEWRLRRGAGTRLYEKHAKIVLKDTRYADRIPIGLPEIIKAANRAALVRYYKDWYRPDNMAVIIVGDVDRAQIETAIAARFGDLTNPPNARRKPAGGVPPATGTRVSIEIDAELATPSVEIMNLVAHRSDSTEADFQRLIVEQMYTAMINERLAQLRRKPETPFLGAATAIESEVRDVDSFSRSAQVKGGNVQAALRALYTETLRAERHGFSQAELDRARTVIARRAEEAADRQATTDSRVYAEEITRNYFAKELMIGADAERDMTKKYLPTITIDHINALVKSFGGANNRVVTISLGAATPGIDEARIKAILAEVDQSDIPAWVEKPLPTALMAKPPAPGKIVGERKRDPIGVTEWTLSNGARVIVKPTEFERDSVLVSAISPGGTAMAKDADFIHARFAAAVAGLGGVADIDADTLGKILAGKQVSVSPSITETTEGLSAQASSRDLETMFQLMHLELTAPRKDPEQFAVWQANSAEQVANQMRSPEYLYFKNATEALYRHSPRRDLPTPDDFAKVNLDKALAFYNSRFGDVSDFTFVIVGEVDVAKLRPLVETYVASLPGKRRKEREIDLGIRKLAGAVRNQWQLGNEPKALVQIQYHAADAWSRDKERDMYLASQALSNALRETMREDKSGVYGVAAGGAMARSPRQERTFTVRFGCDPARVDEMIDAVTAVADNMAKTGIDDEHIDRLKQIYLRTRETELRTNRFWLDRLVTAYRYRDDPNDIPDTSKTLARMTNANLKAAVTRFLDRKQVYTAIRLPATAK